MSAPNAEVPELSRPRVSFPQKLRYKINTDVYANPEKYLVRLPVEKIVADSKVYYDVVCRYGRRIANGEKLAPIIVIKHPKKDQYAIVDGHHRFHALVQMEKKEIECAVEGVFPSIIFYLTKHGFFQPKPVRAGHTKAAFRVVRYFMSLFFHQDVDTLPFTEAEKSSTCP
ncbi:MAG TPA: ParB/RepB/Spo0J family partition protein [Candidatus Bathyarchaeia archaeon]|nr:ParB/RepB/Spo0J family partition protein [Candidatus Bathyarchaeia archaeon]